MFGEFGRRLLMLLRRRQFNADLNEEMRLHRELREQDEIERGISAEEAHYAAQRRFGNDLALREESRDMWGWNWLQQLVQDIRFGVRVLARSPGLTAAAVIALTLGIGANTAIFSVVNGVLLRPLPYRDPGRLVVVNLLNQKTQETFPLSDADFLDWRAQNQVFSEVAAFSGSYRNLTGSGPPERLTGEVVTADYFSSWGVKPLLGRTFLPNEDQPGSPLMAVLSYDLWQRRFGANPGVIGQAMVLNGLSTRLIGVMPAGFALDGAVQVWTNLILNPPSRRGPYYLTGIARLKPGATPEQARAELSTLAHRIETANPLTNEHMAFSVTPLEEAVVGDVRPALLVLLGAVVLVLLIACLDVANLLLARAASREKEMALRVALGANRLRVFRQLLTESVLLAALGGVLGLLLARWGGAILRAAGGGNLPRLGEVSVDGRVFAFTCLITLASGILFGLAPALRSGRVNLDESLREGGRGGTEGRGRGRLRGALVISEVAMCLALLIGASLMLESFHRLAAVTPGIDPHNVLTMEISLPEQSYHTDGQVNAFYRQLLASVEALPGVESAGVGMSLPPNLLTVTDYFMVKGQAAVSERELGLADLVFASPHYFRTLKTPLLRGRYFTDRDRDDSPKVAIINQALANRYWPRKNPIGKHIKTGGADRPNNPWMEVVGVVGDIKYSGLDAPPEMALYEPNEQSAWSSMYLTVRTSSELSDPGSLTTAVRNAVWALDKDVPVAHVRTMESLLSESVQQPRFRTALLGIFALIALTLATVGVYGVLAYTVTQRRHEIGIRIAMGAGRGSVVRLVVGHGMALAGTGVGIGLAGALALTRFLSTLLFGIRPTDPATFVIVPLLLCGIAFLACYIPARRATKIDPMEALRYE